MIPSPNSLISERAIAEFVVQHTIFSMCYSALICFYNIILESRIMSISHALQLRPIVKVPEIELRTHFGPSLEEIKDIILDSRIIASRSSVDVQTSIAQEWSYRVGELACRTAPITLTIYFSNNDFDY